MVLPVVPPPVVSPPVVSPPVRAVVESVAGLASLSATDLPAGLALEDLRALLAAKEQFEVLVLDRLRDMEARRLFELDAHSSSGVWIEAQGTSTDRSAVTLARRLHRLPTVADEVRSGRLSVTAAKQVGWAVEAVRGFLDRPSGLIDEQPAQEVLAGVIVRGVCDLYGEALGGLADSDPRLRRLHAELVEILHRPASQVERIEAAFVALAWRIERRLLRGALQRLIDALLPVQLEERTRERWRKRALAIARSHDEPGGLIEGVLDAETYELLFAALAAAMATDPDSVEDTAAAAALREAGEEPYAPGLGRRPRSRMVRQHDAFRRILQDWLSSGIAGTRGKVVPHLGILCGLGTLEGEPGALPAVGASGAGIAVEVVRRWFCDSAVSRFVVSLGHRVIEASHTQRTLKAHERRAKLVETGGRCQAGHCIHPPGVPLVPHHPEAWARTGRTSFYNSVLLCDQHHHDIHEGGKTLQLRDGRLLHASGWVPQIGLAA
jgi:hypothetical protein